MHKGLKSTGVGGGLAMVVAAWLLTGCMVNSSSAPDYYLLTAQSTVATTDLSGVSLGVGPVRVAPFLERVQMVNHSDLGAVVVSDQQRWAEPLDKGVQRVLVQNLARLTGAQTRNFPWSRSTIPQRALRLDVLDFNAEGDHAVLEVLWVIEDTSGQRPPVRGHERLRQALQGSSPAARAQAYSELLAGLAALIADRLAAQSSAAS